jgi:hypothetical protein
MDLKEAHDLLLSLTKSTDNARIFKEIYMHFNKPDDYDLKQYLEFVHENCYEWFEGLPDKLASEPALSKPKSAILKLISHETVQTAVGAELCQELENNLVQTWRNIKDDLIKARKHNVTSGSFVIPMDQDHESVQENEPHTSVNVANVANVANDTSDTRLEKVKALFLSFVQCTQPQMYEFVSKVVDAI